jgi:hypothetical protein
MGIKTTIAVVPLSPGIAPKIIPMIVPEMRNKIPGHPNRLASVAMRSFQSNEIISHLEEV